MITPKELDAILEVCREHNVSRFTCPEFTVELGPETEDEENILRAIAEAKAAAKTPSPKGVYCHPSLE